MGLLESVGCPAGLIWWWVSGGEGNRRRRGREEGELEEGEGEQGEGEEGDEEEEEEPIKDPMQDFLILFLLGDFVFFFVWWKTDFAQWITE